MENRKTKKVLSGFLILRKCEAHTHGNLKEHLLALPTLDLQKAFKRPPTQGCEDEIDEMNISNNSTLFLVQPSIMEVRYVAAPGKRSAVGARGPGLSGSQIFWAASSC